MSYAASISLRAPMIAGIAVSLMLFGTTLLTALARDFNGRPPDRCSAPLLIDQGPMRRQAQ